jgi:hypothetical protein
MNDAINQTLSRTILTSLTTFFSAAILLFFGGKTLEDFAFVLVGFLLPAPLRYTQGVSRRTYALVANTHLQNDRLAKETDRAARSGPR